MISIVICSRNSKIDTILLENIKSTIGCNFELIAIDNSKNEYSIFQAYNVGITRSKFDFLCFIHDDIIIHTNNWGVKLLEIFNKETEAGLIGLAGAKVKTRMASGWWDCPHDHKAANLMQHFNTEKNVNWNYGFEAADNIEVSVIDGVFMAMKKNPDIQFDTTLKGFHNYDLNICLEFKKSGYKILVTNQIFIEHFSLGNLDVNWLKAIIKFHKQYRQFLPLSVELHPKDIQAIEVKNAKKYFKEILNLGLNRTSIGLLFDFFIIFFSSGLHKEYFKK